MHGNKVFESTTVSESESESEILFILGQPLAQRATINVPSEKYNTEHKITRQKVQFKNENWLNIIV